MFFVRRVRVPSAIYVLHRVVTHVAQTMHRIERALRISAQRMSGVDMAPQLARPSYVSTPE